MKKCKYAAKYKGLRRPKCGCDDCWDIWQRRRKSHEVWVVTGHSGLYVDFRYTKKDMIRHHCQSLGYITWKQAYAKGDRVIKSKLYLYAK